MTTAKKKVSSAKKVIIGMILGAIVGVILNRFAEVPFVDKYIVDILFAIGGGIFTNLIKMMVVPLVFFSLITGTSETGDITKLGRIGVKTMAIYLASTAVALIIALTTGLLLRPGVDLDLSQFFRDDRQLHAQGIRSAVRNPTGDHLHQSVRVSGKGQYAPGAVRGHSCGHHHYAAWR